MDRIKSFLCQVCLTGELPFDVSLPMPKEIIVRGKAELAKKLEEAETDVINGAVSSADNVFGRIRQKHRL